MTPISLSITNFNRFTLLIESFRKVLDDERISEIIISDDASETELFNDVVDYFKTESKVKIHRNATNQGVYRNKFHSVLHATNEWVIVFDSDNVIDKTYIDKLYNIPVWDEHTEYCPDKAKPDLDYTFLSNTELTAKNINSFWRHKQFAAFINTFNSFFNREEFLKHFDPDFEPISSDSIYANYRWLAAGNKIQVVQGMEYYHRIHKGSHYVQNCEKSNVIHASIMEKIKQLR
jgi:glycosyltransferase involved in cell wall biosynthesis